VATGWGKGELNAYARSCHAYKSTVHSSCNLPSLPATNAFFTHQHACLVYHRSAYEGLDLMVQVIMPPVAGRLLAEFQNPRRLPMWLRWGGQPNNGGGIYVVGGVLCLASALIMWTTPRASKDPKVG
jgi:hypothetical protein